MGYGDSEVTDELVEALLAEERRLRAKQPEGWAKAKYRKYANWNTGPNVDELIKAGTGKEKHNGENKG